MLQNAPKCTIPKNISGKRAPELPSKRLASPPPPKKKVGSPLAKPAYAHGQLLRNLFEEKRS